MRFKITLSSDFAHFFRKPKGFYYVRQINDYEEWWLFPFNYPARFYYWLKDITVRI